jgi:hypothetical protein
MRKFSSLFLAFIFIIILSLSTFSTVEAGKKDPMAMSRAYNRDGKPLSLWYTFNSPIVADLGVSSVAAPYGCIGESGADRFYEYTFGGAFVTFGAVQDGGVFGNAEALEWMGYDTEPLMEQTRLYGQSELRGEKVFEKCRIDLYPKQKQLFQEWQSNGGEEKIAEWNTYTSNLMRQEGKPIPIHPMQDFAEYFTESSTQLLGYDLPYEGAEWFLGKTPPWVEEWGEQFGTQGMGSMKYRGAGPSYLSMTRFSQSMIRYGPLKVVDREMFRDWCYKNDKGRLMMALGYGGNDAPNKGGSAMPPYEFNEEALFDQMYWWNHQPKGGFTIHTYVYFITQYWLDHYPNLGLPEEALDVVEKYYGTTDWNNVKNDPRMTLTWFNSDKEKAYTADELWTIDPEHPQSSMRLSEWAYKYGNATEEVNWLLAHEFQRKYGSFPWASKYSFVYQVNNPIPLSNSKSAEEFYSQYADEEELPDIPTLETEYKAATIQDDILFGYMSPEWETEYPDLFEIRVLRPIPETSISDKSPVIEAFIKGTQYYSISDLDIDSTEMEIDGIERDSYVDSYTDNGDTGYRIRHEPTYDFSVGWHEVKIRAYNHAGNYTSKIWNFRILDGTSQEDPIYNLEMKVPSTTWFVGMHAYAVIHSTRNGVPYNDDDLEAEIIYKDKKLISLTRISDGLYNCSWELEGEGAYFIRVASSKAACFDTLHVSTEMGDWREDDAKTSDKVGRMSVNMTGGVDVSDINTRLDDVEADQEYLSEQVDTIKKAPAAVGEADTFMGTMFTKDHWILGLTIAFVGLIGAIVGQSYLKSIFPTSKTPKGWNKGDNEDDYTVPQLQAAGQPMMMAGQEQAIMFDSQGQPIALPAGSPLPTITPNTTEIPVIQPIPENSQPIQPVQPVSTVKTVENPPTVPLAAPVPTGQPTSYGQPMQPFQPYYPYGYGYVPPQLQKFGRHPLSNPRNYVQPPSTTIQSIYGFRGKALIEAGKKEALEKGLPVGDIDAYSKEFAVDHLKTQIQSELAEAEAHNIVHPDAALQPSVAPTLLEPTNNHAQTPTKKSEKQEGQGDEQ